MSLRTTRRSYYDYEMQFIRMRSIEIIGDGFFRIKLGSEE